MNTCVKCRYSRYIPITNIKDDDAEKVMYCQKKDVLVKTDSPACDLYVEDDGPELPELSIDIIQNPELGRAFVPPYNWRKLWF